MNEVLAVHPEDADCVVQAGVTRKQLDRYLRDTGLYFPVDPGADATIGGMVATRASGTTTLRYGATAQNVIALEVVVADGRVIRCGTRARKSSAGYDLVRIFSGSEGTLGIITEATLRLHARPEATGSMACAFPTLRQAIDAVVELMHSGVPLLRMEFLDEVQMRACNLHSQLDLPEKPTLFIEVAGSADEVVGHASLAIEVALSHGGLNPKSAMTADEQSRLWRARHEAYYATRALRPGWNVIISDVCVPISALAETVNATRKEIDEAGVLAPILGHVGDGNFHVIFMADPADDSQRVVIESLYEAMITRALTAGGTCTGEHGIGLGKRARLVDEHGEDAVALMRQLKQTWDPLGILNPGKIFQD
jgi:D-lactate dehydrogenase (cytochrome)